MDCETFINTNVIVETYEYIWDKRRNIKLIHIEALNHSHIWRQYIVLIPLICSYVVQLYLFRFDNQTSNQKTPIPQQNNGNKYCTYHHPHHPNRILNSRSQCTVCIQYTPCSYSPQQQKQPVTNAQYPTAVLHTRPNIYSKTQPCRR